MLNTLIFIGYLCSSSIVQCGTSSRSGNSLLQTSWFRSPAVSRYSLFSASHLKYEINPIHQTNLFQSSLVINYTTMYLLDMVVLHVLPLVLLSTSPAKYHKIPQRCIHTSLRVEEVIVQIILNVKRRLANQQRNAHAHLKRAFTLYIYVFFPLHTIITSYYQLSAFHTLLFICIWKKALHALSKDKVFEVNPVKHWRK